MLTQTYFISDLHLSENNATLNTLFTTFIADTLNQKNTIDAVYILGDFFDVWVGDDLMGPWENRIADQLATLVTAGIPVYFMHGNRDFFVGNIFFQRAKAIFLPDPTVIDLYDKKIVLKHGDDLCLADTKYQRFRRVARCSWIKKLYLSLPAAWRRRIASNIRQESSRRGMRTIYAQILPEDIQRVLVEKNADMLIHGHIHTPKMEQTVIGQHCCDYIVLSDWHTQGNIFFVRSDGIMKLNYFGLIEEK